jgi:hypothetical protein
MVVVVDKKGSSEIKKNTTPEVDLSLSKTENFKTRDTFSFLCPLSIGCPGQGCCALGAYCAVINQWQDVSQMHGTAI